MESMDIEIKRVIHSPSGYHCDFCPEQATKIIKVGLMQNRGGSYFDLCESENCQEKAFEAYENGNDCGE